VPGPLLCRRLLYRDEEDMYAVQEPFSFTASSAGT
jgi:hypothetical protein